VGAGQIISIVNRLEPFGSGFGPVTVPNITVQLSTTDKAPGNLSNTFAENIGPDVTTVFQGDVTLMTPDCTTSPCRFDAGQVDFQLPFDFDPAKGNLLVDFIIPECIPGITDGDATDQFPNITSSIVAVPFNLPVANFSSNFFLISKFTLNPTGPSGVISSVPTLSDWGLVTMVGLLGIVVLIAIRKRYTTS